MEDNMDNGISGIVASLEVQGLIDIHFVLVVDKADIVLVYFMDVGNWINLVDDGNYCMYYLYMNGIYNLAN